MNGCSSIRPDVAGKIYDISTGKKCTDDNIKKKNPSAVAIAGVLWRKWWDSKYMYSRTNVEISRRK
jgi:hypothetical protein